MMRRALNATRLVLMSTVLILTGVVSCSDDTKQSNPDRPSGADLPQLLDRAVGGEGGSIDGGKGDSAKRDSTKTGLEARATDGRKGEAGVTADGPATCGKIRCDCTAYSSKQGKYVKLWGQVKETTTFGMGDFKVRVVTLAGQLKVNNTTMFATKCGEWQATMGIPVFTYELVKIGEDFTIQYDQFFPGINQGACPNCK